MKWAHRIIGTLIGALLLVTLFRILLPAFQGGETWQAFTAFLAAERGRVIIVCLGFIAGLVAFVLTGLAYRPRAQYLSYESDGGNISISLKALQDFLSHLKGEFPAIISLRPQVTAHDEQLEITLNVSIQSDAPVPEISRMLQARARHTILERVGISDIRGIEVKVEEIVGAKESSVKSANLPAVPPDLNQT